MRASGVCSPVECDVERYLYQDPRNQIVVAECYIEKVSRTKTYMYTAAMLKAMAGCWELHESHL